MKKIHRSPALQRLRQEVGIALVVTLSLIVLVTIAAVAFFSRATANRAIESSRANQILAKQVADSASDYVSGQFLQEIEGHSTRYGNDGTVGSTTPPFIYQPATNTFAVPQRPLPSLLTSDTNFANLLRRSVNETTNGVGETNASTHSTATASRNGRTVGFTRWNAPMLLTGTGFSGTTQLSNWIYLNKDGSVTGTPSTNAIGRFAYNVYDVGGLLDANAAGFPSAVSGTNLSILKNTLAGADISVIPGVTDANAFIQWRNANHVGSASAYVTAVTTATNGFLSPLAGDNRITSRQDLINLATSGSYGILTTTLPYLTHFTRELNTPSWGPSTPAGSSVDYAANANSVSGKNRFIPNVRASAATTITRYKSDGTTYTYSIKAGEPAIKKRFPLDRLQWLGVTGPQNGGTAASIQACFGLQWNNINSTWEYVGNSGSVIQSSIKTLATVASENREPNFFEILKAGILAGSLGLGPADDEGTIGMNWHPAYSLSSTNAANLSKLTDYQAIQIGANIVDQYDTDSVPTAIVFDASLTFPFYGTENLPYVNKLFTRLYRPSSGYNLNTGSSQPTYRSWLRGWLAVEMWNPHKNAQVAPSMRIVGNNGMLFFTKNRLNSLGATVPSTSLYYNYLGGNTRYSSTYVTGTQTLSFSDSTFATPAVLAPNAAGGNATNSAAQGQLTDNGLSWTGFWIGDMEEPDYYLNDANMMADMAIKGVNMTKDIVDGSTASHGYQVGPYFTNAVLELQMNTGSGWRTVQKIYQPNQQSSRLGMYFNNNKTFNTDILRFTGTNGTHVTVGSHPLALADPRTQRFGMSIVGTYVDTKPSNVPWQNTTLRGNASPQSYARFMRTPGCYPYNAPDPSGDPNVTAWNETPFYLSGLCENLTSGTSALKACVPDLDTVIRPADGSLATAAGYDALGTATTANLAARPVILNRPFNSIADLGYAFRDQPWKTLDFFSPSSADIALLDLFCLHDEADETSNVSAGKVNLNSARVETLQALIFGANRDETTAGANTYSSTNALTLATFLRSQITSAPLLNVSNVVGALASGSNSSWPSTQDAVVKSQREAALRTLIGSGQVRTWNLFCDIIAQSGRFATATGTGGVFSAGDFIVEGESRYWQSIAVDRFTDQIIDKQIESVSQ